MINLVPIDLIIGYNDRLYTGDNNKVEINEREYTFIKAPLFSPLQKYYSALFNINVKTSAAYILRDNVSDKVYVGSAVNIYNRITIHKSYIKSGKHDNKNLDALLKTANLNNFDLICVFTNDREDAYRLEQFFVDLYKPFNLLLNTSVEDVRTALKGVKHSNVSIEKMRVSATGRKLSPVVKEKIRLKNTGRKHTIESRLKISIGRKTSDIAKQQLKRLHLFLSRAVSVNGTVFASASEASRQLDIGRTYIRKHADSKKDNSIYWLDTIK